ncbi:MAG: nucleotidyltransferase domain-containing protein [Acidimicrobiia bacterium]
MDFVRPIEAIIPGVRGRVLAVLAQTTADLNLRTIARLSDVSLAQASRVLPGLVELGLVERREAAPSSLFRLVREHVVARPLLELARARDTMVEEMGRAAGDLPVVPVSVIVFGSFARGEADEESDIDAVFVRAADANEADESWSASVEQWRGAVRRASGNRVEVLEVGSDEVAARLGSRRQVWREIRRDGLVVHGLNLDQLEKRVDA